MAGRNFTIPLIYADAGDANRLKMLTGKTVTLRESPYSADLYVLAETGAGTGIYGNANVEDKLVRLFIDGAYKTDYGTFWTFGDGAALILAAYLKKDGTVIVTGDFNFGGKKITNLLAGSANGEALIYEQALKLNITNQIVLQTFSLFYNKIIKYLPNDVTGEYVVLSDPGSLVYKKYIDDLIAGLIVTPYQESINLVRCIPSGTTEINKVYLTLLSAIASFSSPGVNNQCSVLIPGTGIATQYIKATPGSLKNYVNVFGAGKHIGLVCQDGSSNTKTMTFKNLTIFFGANDYAVDREYSSFRFEDCDIYHYRNFTANNCELIRSRFIGASAYKIYLKGATKAELCAFNNEADSSLLTTGYKAACYGVDVTTLPTDPSTPNDPA